MEAVDCNGNHVSAELEVKKLQELVRVLERQNERLRSCAGVGTGTGTGCVPGPLDYFLWRTADDGAATSEGESEEDRAEPSVLDELELLDLDSLCGSDESHETWLYVSSRAKGSSGVSLAALTWCRQSLDRSRSEVEAARRSLSLRLEQVSRWRSPLSRASSPGAPLRQVAGVSPVSASTPAQPVSSPQSYERHASCLPSPRHRPLHHRTLSPAARELSPAAERTPTFLPHGRGRGLRRSALTPPPSVDGDLPEAEDDPVAPGYPLHDLADVQVMARLQEESLRQDYAGTSPALAGRRRHSFAFQLGRLGAGLDVEEDEDEDDEDYGLLPPPQPRLTRLPHSHTFSSTRDWRRSTSSLCTPPSSPSTPPYPFAGFTFQHQGLGHGLGLGQGLGLGLSSLCATDPRGFRPESDKLRRSMPNLVGAPGVPCAPAPASPRASPCLLRSSHSFDSSRGPSPLLASSLTHNRVQSVGNFASLSRRPLKATAYVSPTIKGSSSTSTAAASSACLQPLGGGGGVWGHCGAGSGIPLLCKAAGGGAPAAPTTPRSGLPRPASFVGGTSSSPRGKVAQSARSFLTPPKTLSTLSALRDSAWRDGCF